MDHLPPPHGLLEPVPDRTPRDVIAGLGFDPDEIQSLVITSTHVLAVAAGYPTLTPPEPEPDPVPDDMEDPDAHS